MLNVLTLSSFHCLAQTNMVGSLGGEVNVTPMGTATYSIPIEVTPGTNGMQPNLAITYNSTMGRGMLGVGWTLSGFSSISRTQRNNYYDDAIGSIHFDGDDRLALDGERLIKLSEGSYMAENAVYGPEIENFTRVTLNGSPSTPDAVYFTAVTDQGQIIEYGNTTNSKLRLPGGVIFSWMVNKVTDADGNYMSFGYDKDWETGEIWPVQINYTGNELAELSTYAKVQFQYTIDPNTNITYIGGNPVTTSKLLSAIVVKYGSTIVRQYGFEYDYDRSTRLTAVVLKDANGNELTRTSIAWGEDSASTNIQDVSGIVNQGKYILDYNGDNIPDLLLTTISNGGYLWTIKEGNRDGTYQTTNHSGYIGNGPSIFTVDWDGDGRDGFGYVSPIENADSCIFKVKDMRNGTFIDVFTTIRETGSFLLGDFLGCGGAQFLFIGEPGFSYRYVTNSFNNKRLIVPNNSLLSVTDLNGNGKTDFQVVRENYIDVYEYDETTDGFVKIMDSHWFPYNPTCGYHGDFNGDGMMDYIYYTYTNNQGCWYLKISKGNEYRIPELLPFNTFHGNSILPSFPLLISDVNGDGKDDIVQPNYYVPSNPYVVLKVYYSRKFNNDGTGIQFDTTQVTLEGVQLFDGYYYLFADFNQDGKNELFYRGSGSQLAKIISFPERRGHDLVESVTNGLGKTTLLEFQYCNTPAIGYLGQDGRRIHYPLVSKIWQPDGVGGANKTTYSYGYAVFDFERQQLLGFQYFNSYSNGTNVKLEFQHNTTFNHLALEHSLTYYLLRDEIGGYIADSSYWEPERYFSHYETLFAPNYLQLPYGRFVPYSSSTALANRLENSKKIVTCCLNTDGRVSQSTTAFYKVKSPNPLATWVSRDSTVYTYTNVNLQNGVTAMKPSMVKTWNRRNGYSQTPFRQIVYTYSHGKMEQETMSDSDGLTLMIDFTYNSYGLPVTENHKPDGLTATTQSFAYDDKGRFLEHETDELGHISSATYNKYNGLLSSQTDVNNLTTSYEYDALGRVTRITRPDQTTHNISYHWNNISQFPNAVYYSMENEAGTPMTKTYYDILGRAIHSYCEGRGYDDAVYDERGRLVRQTWIPYFSLSATSKTWHEFNYDNYDRVTAESDPYTDLSYFYYDENEASHHEYFVSVEDNIRRTCQTKYYDAMGRLISAEDDGGVISYSYAYETVSGKIRDKMTVTLGNAVTTVLSDIHGNRISIQDPDAGIVTSTYNVLNQLVTRTDANENQTAFSYDLAGRTTRVVYSNGSESDIVAYTYDDSPGKGIGKLASVRHGDNLDCEYVYDSLGRIANRKVYDGNSCYEHLYAYDTLGRLQFLTYPDGFQIKYGYNGYGEFSSIRNANDNSLIYAVDSRNNFRQPVKCRFGNETGTLYSYNSYGMLTGIQNGDITQLGIINGGSFGNDPEPNYFIGDQYRKLTYTYNSRGFISTKTDVKVIQSESYFYDELDRLDSCWVNGVTAGVFTYSNSGNITANSNVGSYIYNTDRPHAVIGITSGLRPAIPSSQCDVTYNLLNRPATLSENGYSITLDYDASGMRRHTEITNGQSLVKEKTRVSDLYELEVTHTSSRRLDYIYAEGRIVAVRIGDGSTGSLYYVLTDHLGSWEKVLDENKTIVQQTHFDPWGNRMSYTAWNTPQTQTSFTFDRGFTGHEHYDFVHVINANARLYDPTIGRFFSPDPFVQAPDGTQGFNRYSYCMNNPVMYSDPTGEFFWAPVIVGAMVGAFFGGIRADQKGENFLGGMIKGAFVGGLGGALGGIGGAGMNYAENLFLGVWEGGFTGYVDGLVWGEDPGKSMLYGMASGAVFTTLTSENLWNALRGKGFKTNANVFEDFKAGLYTEKGGCWQQDALDYFGFEGNYKPETNSITSPGSEYWGSANRTTGDISYGNFAFEDYTSLYGTYLKESWTSHRIKAGLGIHEVSEELKGMPYETYLEEIDGYIHVFKNQGLISYSTKTIKYPFQGIEYYQTLLKLAGSSYSDYPSKYIWLYKIPRRW
jgi:RHS repeat-associated protein